MNESIGQDLIEIGADLGVFVILSAQLEGTVIDKPTMQKIIDLCAQDIQAKTGLLAEDFALQVDKLLDKTLKDAGINRNKEG